jgi:mono/diheme cytochrome c family protein
MRERNCLAEGGGPRCSKAVSSGTLQAARLLAMLGAACLCAAACNPGREGQPAPGPSAPAARPAGLVYAEGACADCHAVEAGQTQSPNPKAPTFETIANTPGVTRMGLSALLHTSHRTMPNLIVDPNRIDDLSAYLDTLKK